MERIDRYSELNLRAAYKSLQAKRGAGWSVSEGERKKLSYSTGGLLGISAVCIQSVMQGTAYPLAAAALGGVSGVAGLAGFAVIGAINANTVRMNWTDANMRKGKLDRDKAVVREAHKLAAKSRAAKMAF